MAPITPANRLVSFAIGMGVLSMTTFFVAKPVGWLVVEKIKVTGGKADKIGLVKNAGGHQLLDVRWILAVMIVGIYLKRSSNGAGGILGVRQFESILVLR